MHNYPFWESVSLPLINPNENLPRELDTAILGNGFPAIWTALWLLKYNPKIKLAIINNDPYFGLSTIYRDLGYSEMLFPISDQDIGDLMRILGHIVDKSGSFIISTSAQASKALSNLYQQVYGPHAVWLEKGEFKKLFTYLKCRDGFFAPQHFTYDPVRILNVLLRTIPNVPIYYAIDVKEVKKHKVITEDGHEIICNNVIHTSPLTNQYKRIVKSHKVCSLATVELSKNLANILPNIPFKFPSFTLRYYQNRLLICGRYTDPYGGYRSLDMQHIHDVMAEAVSTMPFLASIETEYMWARNVDLTSDFYPIVDYSDHEYFMLGLGDTELTSGYICAKIIAEHLVNNVKLPEKFSGGRF